MTVAGKIRVLVLSNSLSTGGAQRSASQLVCALDTGQFQPLLALLQDDITYRCPRGTPVHILGYRTFYDLPATVWRLRRLIQQTRPHVLLGVSTAVNVVAGCAMASLLRRPAWIARVDTHRKSLWFRQRALGLLYPLARFIVANAAGMQQTLRRDYPGQRRKISLLANPVNIPEMERMARQGGSWRNTGPLPMLITVGHASAVKRWDILLRAFSMVVRTTPAALVLCGDGPLLERHKDLARRLNLSDRVHFAGHCRNPFPLLAMADLFILSSEAEGLPNALIEAQGMGLPAVATRCDFGPEEIIRDGLTGKLVPVNDAPALAAAIGSLLADRPRLAEMGAAAAEQARRRFDYHSLCRAWESLILKAAGLPRRPSGTTAEWKSARR